MASQNPPIQKSRFGGVVNAGHPLERPPNSASKCENWRVMPGEWLRLRGGRKARMYKPSTSSSFLQFFRATDPRGFGANDHITQHYDGTDVKWWDWNLTTWILNPGGDYTINQSYGGDFTTTEAAPICQLVTRIAAYNGLGVRDGTNSRPPLVSFGTGTRYFGLDAYAPSGNPTVAFASGAGNNQVTTSVHIWVGLYNTASAHYSNAIYAGEITTTGATGTITVSDLANLTYAYNSATEKSELRYVFYATLDGGQVPYLILTSDYTGPNIVAVTATSASLSLVAGTKNGWVLDLTAEAPTENHPPRPMRDITYVGGRIYGVLISGGGSGSVVAQPKQDETKAADFTYVTPDQYIPGIVYSAAASDVVERDWLGNPEESWPLNNFSQSPNREVPVRLAPAPDGYRLLVITANGTFLVEEAADSLHEWTAVSLIHGISRKEMYQLTPYGGVWVTQRNQIVLLRPGAEELEVLSYAYQGLLTGKTPRFGFYVIDPINEIEKYEVFFTDGTSVVHDFAMGGMGYSTTNNDYTAGESLLDTSGNEHHVVAKSNLYTRDGQVDESGAEVSYDEDYTGPSTKAKTNITGEYRSQWDDLGDSNMRKRLLWVDLIGDNNLVLKWFGDFSGVDTGLPKSTIRSKTKQSLTDSAYRFSVPVSHRFWHKYSFNLTSSYSQQTTWDNPSTQGDLATNFYGGVARMMKHVEWGNRE